MGKMTAFADSLRNLVANLGTARDKAAATGYVDTDLSDDDLVAMYRGAWLPPKIVDLPVQDACRRWRNWQAESLDISAIEAEEKRLNLRGKVQQAWISGRLYGGAALYIGTGDPDPSQPLNPDGVKKGGVKFLSVLNRRALSVVELERDPLSPYYNQPKAYQITAANAGVNEIHPSRLVRFIGHQHPDPELAVGLSFGWGDSVLNRVVDAVKNADSGAANVASLLFEAKVDVLKIPNFMSGLSDPDYEAQVLKRLQLAAVAKGINGALMLDSEEDYQQKNASFSGLDKVIMTLMQIASGAADIPMTRLLGQSPGGLQATGDSDMRNYYDAVQAGQETVLTPSMSVLDECLIRSALGSRPKDIYYDWAPLWQPSAKERADIGKATADTIKVLSDTGLIPEEAMSKTAVNMLTEAGVAPGLEAAVAEYGAELPDDDEPPLEE
jgi:uncharacterized protein